MILAVLVMAASVALLIHWSRNANRRPKGDLWFYNLKTHQLFPASDLSVPPIGTTSGPGTGVRAHVFTCAGESSPTNFIAFLEKLMPGAKREVEEELQRSGGQVGIGFALERRQDGILVSAVGEERWFPKLSPEGLQIMETGRMKGGCSHPKPSLP